MSHLHISSLRKMVTHHGVFSNGAIVTHWVEPVSMPISSCVSGLLGDNREQSIVAAFTTHLAGICFTSSLRATAVFGDLIGGPQR